jgi:hypothetical protein
MVVRRRGIIYNRYKRQKIDVNVDVVTSQRPCWGLVLEPACSRICAVLRQVIDNFFSRAPRMKCKSRMPLTPYGCEGALWCQRLDENGGRLAGMFDAPFYLVHLEGFAVLLGGVQIA